MLIHNLRNYSGNLRALRDFVDLVEPVLEAASREEAREHAEYLIPLVLAMYRSDPEKLDLDEETREMIEEFAKKHEIEKADGDDDEGIRIRLPGEAEPYLEAFKSVELRAQQSQLLYEASLQSLISSTEWFVSRIVHHYYDVHPDAIDGSSDKTFSFTDLKDLGSIEDARKHFIESKVEKFLRAGFKEWIDVFKSRLNLSMGYLDETAEEISEVFQRRNLVVHNGGVVNTIYISKVPEDLREGIKVGDGINISREYLDESISLFERNFILIAAELWKKLDLDDASRSDVLIDIAFEHLQSERWKVAESLSYFISRDSNAPKRSQLIGLINYWQSLKWQGRFSEVSQDVEECDFSANDEIFQLAKYVLLDENDRFFDLTPGMVDKGTIPSKALVDWPLFRQMREDPRFENLREELDIREDGEPVSIRDNHSA
jgi:hypothetical protein